MTLLQRLVRRFNLSQYLGWSMRKSIYGQEHHIPFLNGSTIEETESWISRYLAAFMEAQPGLFVDVGVNLGQTLLKVKSIDRGRSYVGFEASVECIHYANELVRLNQFKDVIFLPVALAETQRLAQLSADSTTDDTATLVEGFRNTASRHTSFVLAERGDDILSLIPGPPVGIIKIDVEGAELEVLMGLKNTMQQKMPIVTCEILPVYDAGTDIGRFRLKRQTDLLQLMQSLGYTCFRMGHTSGLERVEEIGVHSSLDRCDYAFLPLAMIPRLSSLV